MNETPENSASGDDNRPAVPRVKLWIFFGLFFIVAVVMYAGTMYRIQNYGFTGTGKDQLARSVDGKDAPAQPQQ